MVERGKFYGKLQTLYPSTELGYWICQCECEQIDEVPILLLESGEYDECLTCASSKFTPLLGYYLGRTPDNEGRMLKDTWGWSDGALELCHDYIQWWFPTKTLSNFNEAAPILTDLEIKYWESGNEAFSEAALSMKTWLIQYPRGGMKTYSILDDNFVRTYERFLRFMGLRNGDNAIDSIHKDSVKEAGHVWNGFNHNHLRITRMLESMRWLGYLQWAEDFVEFAEELNQSYEYVNISENTFSHWRKALVSP